MSESRDPNYNIYIKAAEKYLDMEEELLAANREAKKWTTKAYSIANRMSRYGAKNLGLLGFRVVDQLRAQRTKSSRTNQEKSTSQS